MDHDEARDWLAARCGENLGPPPGFFSNAGIGDPVSMMLRGAPASAVRLSPLACALIYEGESEVTKRIVRFSRGWFDREVCYVSAFCTLRFEPRLFRADRMVELIDLGTGEIIADAVTFFEGFGLSRKDDPMRATLRRAKDGLAVLAAIAASDGVVHDEIESMLRFVDRVAELDGVMLGDADFARIGVALTALRPSAGHAAHAYDRLAADPAVLRLLGPAIEDLVAADDRLSFEERRAIEALYGVAA
ncbi:hypothetical protein [Chenggangzhangella methanolivorans]|uniref:Tellurite resistance protein TerB n=1 Tax=Chenggangzhangella methanolivorans TaxID=1437009 RepID=A0A9E6R795_9HYPH|nr:hypothetical protein [Chenggangzhangella methanolivorans]QZN99512.1 hypothetical protein K6K41_22830 [Chenggangzhangella methanolivorans]